MDAQTQYDRPDGRPDGSLLFSRLDDHGPLRWRADACLVARYPDFSCNDCRDGCPAGLFTTGDGAVRLADGCLGCGRCVAACPTGALAMPGASLPEVAADGSRPVEIECWKVPTGEIEPDTVQVPCLGALRVSQLLDMRHAAGSREIAVIDRGWCQGCEAGGGESHAAASLVDTVNGLLGTVGVPGEQMIAVRRVPLAEKRRPARIPDPAARKALDRRSFISTLGRQAVAGVHEVRTLGGGAEADENDFDRRTKIWPAERAATLAALSRLARRNGTALPPALSPAIAVGDGCNDCRGCAAICPTGALWGYDAESEGGLRFSSQLCTSCRLCAQTCPAEALVFKSEGGLAVGVATLTTFGRRRCFDCGRSYPVDRGEPVGEAGLPICPACSDAQGFMREIFGGGGKTIHP